LAPVFAGLGANASGTEVSECPPAFRDIANLSTDIKDWAQFQSDEEVEQCLTPIARRLGPNALTEWLNESGLKAIRTTNVGKDAVYFGWMIKRQGGPLLHGTSFAWLKRWTAWSESYAFHWENGEKVILGRSYIYI
jgi:hypothetical protein